MGKGEMEIKSITKPWYNLSIKFPVAPDITKINDHENHGWVFLEKTIRLIKNNIATTEKEMSRVSNNWLAFENQLKAIP